MQTRQQAISSGFGPRSTTGDVLAGLDLSGKTALVTGGYSGLGLETVRALTDAGAKVIVPARREAVARDALGGMVGVTVGQMDLGDLESVRRFADSLLAEGTHIDIAIASAGIMASSETRIGEGWEAQFATNHLGHFVLVNRIWPLLRGGARVVMVSSGAHGISDIRWDDLNFSTGYDKWQAYGQSKTANALFAVELDRLGQSEGVRGFSLNPGSIVTPLQRHLPREEMMAAGWVDAEGRGIDPSFKTPEQGAATQVWAATSPQLAGLGGVYCEDCDIAGLIEKPGDKGVHKHAVDPASATRLWRLSAELTGEDAFAAA